MFLKRVEIENIRGIRRLVWAPTTGPGWHVILGDNASGKSSTLRAIALALVGASEATALRQSWDDWLHRDAATGSIKIDIEPPREWGPGWDANAASIRLDRRHPGVDMRGELIVPLTDSTRPAPWFSAAYGPFRRFRGGDKDAEKLYQTNPRLARHLTLFDESIALSECLAWLQTLRFKALESQNRGDADGGEFGRLLQHLTHFINRGDLLPHGVRMASVDSERVTFRDANNCDLDVEELSDGFRSILSLTFELIRQLVGVVLIDEIDAHLHPNWQRRIGRWFTTCFPQIQFIVTTHSPLVCQAAVHGSVFRLALTSNQRCMYCEDSCADEVEHIRPKHLYPETTFVWTNYLYACGPCNGPKSPRYPLLVDGQVNLPDGKSPPSPGIDVLIDPRRDDPCEFLSVDLLGSAPPTRSAAWPTRPCGTRCCACSPRSPSSTPCSCAPPRPSSGAGPRRTEASASVAVTAYAAHAAAAPARAGAVGACTACASCRPARWPRRCPCP